MSGDDGSDGRVGRLGTALGVAGAAGVGVGVLGAARRSRRRHPTREPAEAGAVRVRGAVTVNRPAADAYALWRDLSRLPSFMIHLQAVEERGDGRWRWTARGPAGTTVEWDAVVDEDVPGELISWRSTEPARVGNAGTVRFGPAPGGRGTEVRVELTYEPPAGGLGVAVARLLGDEPHQQVTDDLRRFKQVLETGEVLRSDASPEGHDARRQLRQRPGQPVGAVEPGRGGKEGEDGDTDTEGSSG